MSTTTDFDLEAAIAAAVQHYDDEQHAAERAYEEQQAREEAERTARVAARLHAMLGAAVIDALGMSFSPNGGHFWYASRQYRVTRHTDRWSNETGTLYRLNPNDPNEWINAGQWGASARPDMLLLYLGLARRVAEQ